MFTNRHYIYCMRILLILLILLTCGVFGVAYWYFGGFGSEGGEHLAFIDAYATYREEADLVHEKMLIAGGSQSPDRQALFVLLSSILTDELSDEERAEKTREANTHVEAIGSAIAVAQAHVPRVRGSITDVRSASEQFSSRPTRTRAGEVVNLLTAHIELTERSVGELFDANEQVRRILAQIEEDGGKLTDAHVTSINEATTEAETRFDQLTRHFDELSSLGSRRDEAYRAFVDRAF